MKQLSTLFSTLFSRQFAQAFKGKYIPVKTKRFVHGPYVIKAGIESAKE